jgi:hypothetical protein
MRCFPGYFPAVVEGGFCWGICKFGCAKRGFLRGKRGELYGWKWEQMCSEKWDRSLGFIFRGAGRDGVSGSGRGEMGDGSPFYQAQGKDDLKQATATVEEQVTARANTGVLRFALG